MKKIFAIVFLSVSFSSSAQDMSMLRADTTRKGPRIKCEKIYEGKKLRGITNYDEKGNCYFVKNDGMNGPVIMIWGTDFDAEGKETRSVFAHSNIGFSVYDKEYSPGMIKSYAYTIDAIKDSTKEEKFEFKPFDFVGKIGSKNELEKQNEVKQLLKGRKYLQSIDYLDANKNVIRSVSLEENGDTSSVTISRYNKWNKEEFFHNEWRGSMSASWDIYYDYDPDGNMIQSLRVTDKSNGTGKDTSEVYYYKYENNRLTEDGRYQSMGTDNFDYRTIYVYDKDGNRAVELYYEKRPDNLVATHKYKFNKNGNLVEEECYDFRDSRDKPKYIYTTRYEYWK